MKGRSYMRDKVEIAVHGNAPSIALGIIHHKNAHSIISLLVADHKNRFKFILRAVNVKALNTVKNGHDVDVRSCRDAYKSWVVYIENGILEDHSQDV